MRRRGPTLGGTQWVWDEAQDGWVERGTEIRRGLTDPETLPEPARSEIQQLRRREVEAENGGR